MFHFPPSGFKKPKKTYGTVPVFFPLTVCQIRLVTLVYLWISTTTTGPKTYFPRQDCCCSAVLFKLTPNFPIVLVSFANKRTLQIEVVLEPDLALQTWCACCAGNLLQEFQCDVSVLIDIFGMFKHVGCVFFEKYVVILLCWSFIGSSGRGPHRGVRGFALMAMITINL